MMNEHRRSLMKGGSPEEPCWPWAFPVLPKPWSFANPNLENQKLPVVAGKHGSRRGIFPGWICRLFCLYRV